MDSLQPAAGLLRCAAASLKGLFGARRLLTANFLHDSFVHLASSCYALATVAPAIEEVRLLPQQPDAVGSAWYIAGCSCLVGGAPGLPQCTALVELAKLVSHSGWTGLAWLLVPHCWLLSLQVLGGDIFLAVYVLSAVAGSVGTFIFGDAVTVGASSGIFGLIGGGANHLGANPMWCCLFRTAAAEAERLVRQHSLSAAGCADRVQDMACEGFWMPSWC